MNMKLVIAGLTTAACLLAQPPGGPRGRGPMEFGGPGGPGLAATVAGAPYSAVEVRTSQQVLAGGNSIQRQEQTNVYRDAQGRVRRETTRTGQDGQTETRVAISDPVAGTVYELNPRTKTAVSRTVHFPDAAQTAAAGQRQGMGARGGMGTMGADRRQGRQQTDANVKRETLAAQSMHGVLASGTRVTRTIPAGTIGNAQAIETVRETWMADDLKVALMTKTSDPRVGTSVVELTNVNRSQPDATLFQVPSDYTVKKAPGGMGGGRGPGVRGQGRPQGPGQVQ